MTRLRLLLLGLVLVLTGCGSQDDFDQVSGQPGGDSLRATHVSATEGGRVAHPSSGHAVAFSPNALSDNALIAVRLLEASQLTLRNDREFTPVGQAIRVDSLGTARFVGAIRFEIPFSTSRSERYGAYLHFPDSLVLPLETRYDAESGLFHATLDLTGSDVLAQAQASLLARSDSGSLTVSLVDESGYLSRPPHTNWPSYNLYAFQNGSFVKVIDQGQTIGASPLPTPGSSPLMVVHGLGSDIAHFQAAASYLQQTGAYSQIYGYEYDTLAGLQNVGPRLVQAYNTVETDSSSQWHHLAHSMGTLVSRTAFESEQSLPYTSNQVVFAAGPHQGASIINALQGNLSLFQRFVRYLVVNEAMDFTNADGTPCQVDITAQGFNDLASGSATLAALNTNASSRHPKEAYRTLGGNAPGLKFDLADYLIGVYPSDGLVDLSSANPGSLIGAVDSAVVPTSHTDIVLDTNTALPKIQSFLQAE